MRAVNDVPIAFRGEDEHLINWGPALFGAFVNENSPEVDKLLKEALHWNAIASFTGYQADWWAVRPGAA